MAISKNNSASGINSGVSRFNISTMENASTSKLPTDIGDSKKNADGFYHVPCKSIVEYPFKDEYDFSSWPEEKFEELIASIKEFGVLHPIILRFHGNSDATFEVLAGEHRWKASVALGLETIPAQILSDCDDEKAKSIFTLTNVVSRELTLEDKIQGWSHYYVLTKGKTEKTIKELREKGILNSNEDEDISKRQILRFHKINTLQPKLKQLLFDGIVKVNTAETFTVFNEKEQALISKHVDKVTSSKNAKAILQLKQGEIDGYKFNEAGLEYVLSKEFYSQKEINFSYAFGNIRTVLKEKLKKEHYANSAETIGDALDIYNRYNGRKDIIAKAVSEYLENHPEEDDGLDFDWHLEQEGL